jgi:hypothetical protein
MASGAGHLTEAANQRDGADRNSRAVYAWLFGSQSMVACSSSQDVRRKSGGELMADIRDLSGGVSL